jgi:hypothetical protein
VAVDGASNDELLVKCSLVLLEVFTPNASATPIVRKGSPLFGRETNRRSRWASAGSRRPSAAYGVADLFFYRTYDEPGESGLTSIAM